MQQLKKEIPVPDSPCGLYGRKATLEEEEESK